MVKLSGECKTCGKAVTVRITRCYGRDYGEVFVEGVLSFAGDNPQDCELFCSEKCVSKEAKA